MIKEVFKGDQAFIGALDKACSAIVNHRPVPRQPTRAPELVNNFASPTAISSDVSNCLPFTVSEVL